MTALAALEEPLYFSSEQHGLFGWLHRAVGHPSCDTGVVICKPFGFEAICGHRSLRAFARMAAASGFPTLRFDYLGTGDSADGDAQIGQIDAWCRDVVAGIAELRRCTGVERVCLLGFRLGALLATLAAHQSRAVESLILVAPVVSGRRYLGEMRTTRLAALLGASAPATGETSNQRVTATDGSMEVSGHHISAATIAELERIDLATMAAPQLARILIIDRNDLPSARTWVDSLTRQGIRTEYVARPGFVKMMMTGPQFTVIPDEMLETARDWLLRSRVDGPSFAAASTQRPVEPAAVLDEKTVVSLAGGVTAADAGIIERPVLFGSESTLFGIVTEPSADEVRRRGVILLNSGADYHISIGRLYVSLARRWARRGYVVLRMDLAGLGDSYTPAGRRDNEVYPQAAVDDVRAAIHLVRNRYRVDEVTVAGLCSGAYHALQAAIEAVPLNRVMMVNPETFVRPSGETLEDVLVAEVVKTRSTYSARMRSFKHWKKILTGQADVLRIARVLLLRTRWALTARLRGMLRYLHIRLPNDLGWQLEQIAGRGTQITMVFAHGEPGIELLHTECGAAMRRLGERVRVRIIDDADHTFSRSSSRAKLEKVLSDELFTQPARLPEECAMGTQPS